MAELNTTAVMCTSIIHAAYNFHNMAINTLLLNQPEERQTLQTHYHGHVLYSQLHTVLSNKCK